MRLKVLFLAVLLMLSQAIPANAAVSSISGFNNRADGDTITASIWNTELGGVYSYINSNLVNTLNVPTTKGDIFVHDGSNLVRLGVGTNGQNLQADSTQASGMRWASPGGLPTTTNGDIIIHSGGTATRLPIGTAGQVLTVSSSLPSWQTSTSAFSAGMIVMWSGAIGSIPSGWHLCDGTSGTPNLQGLFIVGAGNVAPAATGGLGNLSIGATGGASTHTHTFTSNTHTHTFSDESNLASTIVTGLGGGGSGQAAATSHTHDVSGTTSATAVTGTTASTANSPPYYALAFIQKL